VRVDSRGNHARLESGAADERDRPCPLRPGTTPLEIFYQLTGRQLPPARKSTRMPPAPDDRFQPLLEAWWNSSEPDRA
jgi:hypothetical protein